MECHNFVVVAIQGGERTSSLHKSCPLAARRLEARRRLRPAAFIWCTDESQANVSVRKHTVVTVAHTSLSPRLMVAFVTVSVPSVTNMLNASPGCWYIRALSATPLTYRVAMVSSTMS